MSGRVHLSCPWCDWAETIQIDKPQAEATAEIEDARRLVEQHAAEAGHAVIKGRRPRVGYFKGAPIS